MSFITQIRKGGGGESEVDKIDPQMYRLKRRKESAKKRSILSCWGNPGGLRKRYSTRR